jgi:type II secretory pathway pseudopilin PulG
LRIPRLKLSEAGFTLAEMSFALALSGLLGLVLISTIQMQSRAVQTANSMSDLQLLTSLTQHALRAPPSSNTGCFYAMTGSTVSGTSNVKFAPQSSGTGTGSANSWPSLQISQGMNLQPKSIFGSLAISSINVALAPGSTPLQYNTALASDSGTLNTNTQYQAILTIQAGPPANGLASWMFGSGKLSSISIPVTILTDASGTFVSCNTPPGTSTTDMGALLAMCTNSYGLSNVSLECPQVVLNASPKPSPSYSYKGGGGGGGPGGGRGCFTAGTQVLTEHGNVPIEKISAGDAVYSYDTQSGQSVLSVVDEVFVHPDRLYGEVILDDGTRLEVTPVHRFFLPNAADWKPIGKLRVGDTLLEGLDESAHAVKIKSMDFNHMKTATVYNFSVRGFHNYYVEGVLVHNNKLYGY